MPTPDEPLPTGTEEEIEEISTDFIIPDEPDAPAATDDPFVSASRALVAEPPRAAPAAPRASSPAPREPEWKPQAVEREEPTERVAAPAPAAAPHRVSFPLLPALVFLLVGAAGGFFGGVLWERQATPKGVTVAAPLPPPEPPLTPAPDLDDSEPARPTPKAATKAKPTRKPPTAARPLVAKGRLKLTAPAEATVILDGRRIGRGSLNVEVPAGVHRIEVRLGKAKVAERFWIEPNETWTYDVTPSK